MNYYSDTYSKHRFIFRDRFGKLDISLSNQWFSLILIEVSERVAHNQITDKKTQSPEIRHFVDNSVYFSDITTT